MDYTLSEKFGWTKEQVDNTPEETVMAYMVLMRIQAKENSQAGGT